MGLLQLKRLMLGRNTILSLPPSVSYDSNALAYISAVETADGQALETGVRNAINAFVVGCKADGTWNAIKACCILSGARTLSGALVPLAGTAPTNNNFVSGDYDRKTGLVGNKITKYLDSNRQNAADPQNNKHHACFVSAVDSLSGVYMAGGINGYTGIFKTTSSLSGYISSGTQGITVANQGNTSGLKGVTRSNSSQSSLLSGGIITNGNTTSVAENTTQTIAIFAQNYNGITLYSNARLAFYSIGESLDLALLNTRVSTLISTFAAVIP